MTARPWPASSIAFSVTPALLTLVMSLLLEVGRERQGAVRVFRGGHLLGLLGRHDAAVAGDVSGIGAVGPEPAVEHDEAVDALVAGTGHRRGVLRELGFRARDGARPGLRADRKSTRLNSSH